MNLLNDWLATEVMGWHKEINDYPDSRFHETEYQWVDKDGRILYHVRKSETLSAGGAQHYWHPDTDISQALMCAEKMEDYDFSKNVVTIWLFDNGKWYTRPHDTIDDLPLAICECIYQAKTGKEWSDG